MRLRLLLVRSGLRAVVMAARRPRSAGRAGTRRPPGCRSRCAPRASTAARSTRSRGRRPSPQSATSSGCDGLPVTGTRGRAHARGDGPARHAALRRAHAARGAFGWDVAVLQFLLVRQGISVPVNAYFDGPTLHGVRLMQERAPPARDGVVGPHTFAALVRRDHVPLAHGRRDRRRHQKIGITQRAAHARLRRPRRPRGRVALVDRAALRTPPSRGSRGSTTSTRRSSC